MNDKQHEALCYLGKVYDMSGGDNLRSWSFIDNRYGNALVKRGYAIRSSIRAFGKHSYRITSAGAAVIGRDDLFTEPTPETLSAAQAQVDEIHARLKQEINDGLQAEADYVKFYASADDDLSDPDVLIDEPVNSKPLAVCMLNNDDELERQLAERDAQIAALQARVKTLETALRDIRDYANQALEDWSGVAYEHIPEQYERYWFIRADCNDALNTNDAQTGE